MGSPRLRVLIVEDVEEDAELIASQLLRSGFAVECDRVDSLIPLRKALTHPGWDLILTDYTMPSLTVPTVLQLVREQQVTVPCILVSGTASDETARASMKLGMTDFVNKNNLAALGPVVTRALTGERLRRVSAAEPRLRMASGQELQVVEWSQDRRVLDGEPLRPGSEREGLFLEATEATRVRVHVLGCAVHSLSSVTVIYRSLIALLGH